VTTQWQKRHRPLIGGLPRFLVYLKKVGQGSFATDAGIPSTGTGKQFQKT
jgi:hypothetical protein